jgi:hypothetical protein
MANDEQVSLTEWQQALLDYVWAEVERVYWNNTQTHFDAKYGEPDHGIAGLVIRRYWWGDEDEPAAELPHIELCGLQFRWYKYYGRSMTVSREMSFDEWLDWFDAALGTVRASDVD